MFASRNNGVIAAGLVLAVFLWGGNNTGVKFLVQSWPPIWIGGTRFVCAGLLLLVLLRWTDWLGRAGAVPPDLRGRLWWRGGLSLAVYIVAFNWAVQLTAVSHVALYLGASPVWALLWEASTISKSRLGTVNHRGGDSLSPCLGDEPSPSRGSGSSAAAREHREWLKRYAAAALALAGVLVLFWPTLKSGQSRLGGELLGLAGSVLWTNYGRQCRALSANLSGAEITAHTMWRAGVLLLPLALWEVSSRGVAWNAKLVSVQLYCVVAGGVIAFALWTNALRHWQTSEVYLFNNLIPLSTMLWAYFCLAEPMTSTFWIAMALIVSGVVLGQTNWQKLFAGRWLPTE